MFEPIEPLTISEWSERYRYLSAESSSESGKYMIARAEYQRGMMDAISDPSIRRVVFMTSSQVGKTTLLENIIGYFIHYEPSPILMVQPTLSMAQAFSKDRLSSMIRDCPILTDKVKAPRERDSGNTVLHKTFVGGHISLVGSNSTSSLASRPIRVLLLDEVDRFEISASEGDVVNLASKRTTTFWNNKIVMVSTPTVKGLSRIEQEYELGDKRKFYVPCNNCSEEQVLEFKQVKFLKEKLNEAYYECRFCGDQWDDSRRWKAIRKGYWKATGEPTGIASFHLSELYSSWSRLEDISRNFLEAKKLPETLKVFVNTSLGESWEDKGSGLDMALNERTEDYTPDSIPNESLIITAGIDVQGNRLEMSVMAVGLDEELFILDHIVLYGDPSTTTLWLKLDEELKRTYKREDGKLMTITSACVDSGYYTNQVYSFCKSKVARRVYAIKGISGNKPLFPRRASINNVMKCPLFTIGVDSAKDILLSRLKIEKHGSGYVHFPKHLDNEYFLQLQSERIKTKFLKGIATREWVQVRKRNEAWDCLVYAYASFISLNANLEKIKESLDKAPKQQKNKPTFKKNFITDWRD